MTVVACFFYNSNDATKWRRFCHRIIGRTLHLDVIITPLRNNRQYNLGYSAILPTTWLRQEINFMNNFPSYTILSRAIYFDLARMAVGVWGLYPYSAKRVIHKKIINIAREKLLWGPVPLGWGWAHGVLNLVALVQRYPISNCQLKISPLLRRPILVWIGSPKFNLL